MKRILCFVLALFIALGVAFMGTTRAEATLIVVPAPDPYAVPSNDMSKMSTEVLGQAVLPGTISLSSGKLSPLGFTEGFFQYGGPGLKVMGLVKPVTATVCFPFRGYNFKWVGKIYQWNGMAWAAVATSFPKDGDGVVNWACTKGAGNGIYSLIIWYSGPIEPPFRLKRFVD
jgi:hypothetical protein